MYPYHYDEVHPQEEMLESQALQPEMQEYKFFPPGQKQERVPSPPFSPDQRHGQKPFPPFPPDRGPEPPHGHDHGKPRRSPPEHIPKRKPYVYAVDPGAIRGCLYNFTYVWLANGRAFWFYPSYVGRQSVSGYRWSHFGWTYIGMDLDSIQSFSCGA